MSRGASVLFSFCMLASLVSTVFLFRCNWIAGVVQACVIAALAAAFLIYYLRSSRYYKDVIEKANTYFDFHGSRQDYPIPMAVVGHNNDIVWYNDRFRDKLLGDGTASLRKIDPLFSQMTPKEAAAHPEGIDLRCRERLYTVYTGVIDEAEQLYCLYYLDNTELKQAAADYKNSKPAIVYLVLDNMDELQRNFKSSECEVINGGIETILEAWAAKYPCLLEKFSDGNYFMVIEERGLEELMENRFQILKKVREYTYGENPVELTISIGAGRGRTLPEANEHARLALEMSQSRGGDQATVNSDGTMEFFGGTVGGTTSSSKVKARIMSQNFNEIFKRSDIIFAVGHTFSDFDSIGAAIGVFEMARAVGKPCFIITNRSTTMAMSLLRAYVNQANRDLFIRDDTAFAMAKGKRTTLVVVDTHRPNSLEYPNLTEHFDTVCVIDHHRRTANYIKPAEIFYSEPNSSSACEMVTELIEYFPDRVKLEPMSANALLSGIMLDTRNFVLGTGVRTFEAAAYLKNKGANTVAVKQLFSNSLDNYKIKASILNTAETYRGCAIATTTESVPNMRMIASQVADEMLSVTGVKSSYVLFEENGRINISARSLGKMNVQVIMEKLGGGGHFTMAATQMEHTTMEEAAAEVRRSIDEYLEME